MSVQLNNMLRFKDCKALSICSWTNSWIVRNVPLLFRPMLSLGVAYTSRASSESSQSKRHRWNTLVRRAAKRALALNVGLKYSTSCCPAGVIFSVVFVGTEFRLQLNDHWSSARYLASRSSLHRWSWCRRSTNTNLEFCPSKRSRVCLLGGTTSILMMTA